MLTREAAFDLLSVGLEITKATTMEDMLQYDMGIAYVLMQSGMHCVGCPPALYLSS